MLTKAFAAEWAEFNIRVNAGLHTLFHVPISELVEKYGQRDSTLVYAKSDLISRWLRQHLNRFQK